ncbi:uncharacterized protein LOC112090970 [Morus notabilis]|uniref:uncharacterized protein LOC112090970 n=1 Tax=Morus notabilis TaxID=981085 RepID=UPI000CECF9FC|nr:uncharacterized protein LOC112090970 [Morus notabilis]
MSDASTDSTTVPQSSLNNPSSTDVSKISATSSESHSVHITTIRLNGDNFLRWSQSVRMYIRGRGKMGYLTGEKKAPAEDDPAYATWDAENSMVMTWLVNSMEEDIGSNYMCYPTARELWENRFWQDLDLFNTYEWKSPEDAQHHKKTVEDSHTFKFLAGLNVEFDEVRGRIIGRPPLPSIGEVFSEVRREETRRNVMLGKKGPGIAEGSALASTAGSKAPIFQRKTDEKQ